MFGYLLQIRNYLAILGFNPGVKSTYFHCTMPYFSLIVIIIFSKFLYSEKICHFNPVHKGIHIALKMTGLDCLDNCCHLFIFLFWHVHTRKGRWGIRINGLHFMRCGPQPIELPPGDTIPVIVNAMRWL